MDQVHTYATIPSDDAEFRSSVEKLAEQAEDLDRLREGIATAYPSARVSVQSSLGTLPGQPVRVYVYRDGGEPRGEA
jgi:hypothetical protein